MNTKITISKAIYAVLFSVVMLIATTSAFAQVKIGTSPTVIGANSNLEVEAGNGRKVVVDKNDGRTFIENKPLAAPTDSLVLRGPITGELRQMSQERFLQQLHIPETIFSGTLSVNQQVPVWTLPHDQLSHRINLTPLSGYTSVWNATTKQVTLPTDGFYHVEVGLVCFGVGNNAGTIQNTRIFISNEDPGGVYGGGGYVFGSTHITTTVADWQSVVWSGRWTGGTTISLDGYTHLAPGFAGPASPANCKKAYMNITRTR